MTDEGEQPEAIERAFGSKNRARLITEYFAEHPADAAPAWEHVYRLLLWCDQTIGLAHCYESDKCQPGKPWYPRSLAFHDWLANSLGVAPLEVADEIDWMFRRATTDLTAEVVARTQARAALAEKQRVPFADRGMPEPGEDPELVSIIREELGDHLSADVTPEVWRNLVQRIRNHLALENKRKNLLGEGFEDVLAAVISTKCASKKLEVQTRILLHELSGFGREKQGEKPNKVDLAVIRSKKKRTIVTAKWSVRADREKQFVQDFGSYSAAQTDLLPWEYVLVTNEFDPARLMRACAQPSGNKYLFDYVVHVSTDGLLAAYGPSEAEGGRKNTTMDKVRQYIEDERLIGIDRWLELLGQ